MFLRISVRPTVMALLSAAKEDANRLSATTAAITLLIRKQFSIRVFIKIFSWISALTLPSDEPAKLCCGRRGGG
jgi:hypothetical protein